MKFATFSFSFSLRKRSFILPKELSSLVWQTVAKPQPQFRTDLRNIKNLEVFFIGMLKICNDNDLVLIDEERNILEPNFEILREKITKSRAIEFLDNPTKFLDNIVNEHKNIR